MNRRDFALGTPGALLAAAALMPATGLAQGTTPAASQAPAPAPTPAAGGTRWATSWAASVQGPYPTGNPSAMPDQRFAFPTPAEGARDQTFRLILRPTLWGRQARFRFSNAFGTRPLVLDGAHAGLQLGAATLVPGTNAALRFGGQDGATIPPGGSLWSDPVELPFVTPEAQPMLAGRKLAVSFHVGATSGPMTWHAKALQTSYVSAPGAGARGAEEGEQAFPFSTTAWFFLDAVDMMAPAGTPVIVGFGDSITDGTASTLNGDDRWPDVLWRRLSASAGRPVAVVNAGIGGNQVAGPARYDAATPFAGGPSATTRLERDVISLSGVTCVVWLEGINDFSRNGNATLDAVQAGMRDGVAKLRAGIPGVRVIGATVTTALGSSSAAHGHAEQDEKRKGLNAFIRDSGLFDGVADFAAAVLDEPSGGLKPEMVPESTTGGPGDKLHPNRAGYLAMAANIDPALVLGR